MDARNASLRWVPLGRALEIIGAQVFPGASGERLDGLACTISALVPLFVVDGEQARQLNDQELRNALFRGGGREMYFTDGRPPIGKLAVTPEGIARVLGVLKGASL